MNNKIMILVVLLIAAVVISGCNGVYTAPTPENDKATFPSLGQALPTATVAPTDVPTTEPAATAVPTNVPTEEATQEPTNTVVPTEEATQEPTNTVVPTDVSTEVVNDTPVPSPKPAPDNGENGNGVWEIHYYDEFVTDEIAEWEFDPIQPELWPVFPNVDNPLANFDSSNGLEYGLDESLYGQDGNEADIIVAPWSYFLFTGDYSLEFENGQTFKCSSDVEDRNGCSFEIFNVAAVSESVMRDQGLYTGFLVRGRYWNGDTLPIAIWGLVSHTTANMLNINTELNPQNVQNAGGNCSHIDGCQTVESRFFIVSGNELIMWGEMTYTE